MKNKKQKGIKELKKNVVTNAGKNKKDKQKGKGKAKVNKKPIMPKKNIKEIKKEFENNELSNNNSPNKSQKDFNIDNNSEK